MPCKPRISLPPEDLLVLIESHDSWVGSMHPDDHEEYLSLFAKEKARAARLIAKQNNPKD